MDDPDELIATTFIDTHQVLLSWPINENGARENRIDVIYRDEVIYSHYEQEPLSWLDAIDAVESTVYALTVVYGFLKERIEERLNNG